jgi:uncharacterized protein YuzE
VKVSYYLETDSLYIDLADKTSVDSREIASGITLDLDNTGALVGIDFDHALKRGIVTGLLLLAIGVVAAVFSRISQSSSLPVFQSDHDQKTTL